MEINGRNVKQLYKHYVCDYQDNSRHWQHHFLDYFFIFNSDKKFDDSLQQM